MTHYNFNTPVGEAEIRALRVNDTVTLNATLYGIRDATQIHMFDRGRKTRFDLAGPRSHKAGEPRTRHRVRRYASAPPPARAWSASPGR